MEVLLFGILAEKAGRERIELSATTAHRLRQRFNEVVPEAAEMNYSIAIDQRIVHEDVPLLGHEEIAMLPPFAGG